MAESKTKREGYLAWSRDPAIGLLVVAPLWVAYELLRLFLDPQERNGAEALMSEAFHWLGPASGIVPRVLFFVAVLVSAYSVLRRDLPWVRIGFVAALEGTLWGLVLGPLAAVLAEKSHRLLGASAAEPGLVHDVVASLGAGIFEELFFRLLLLPLLVLLLLRACDVFAVPRSFATAGGILLSAFIFAVFHHIGPGAPPAVLSVLLFRTAAGTLLGALFVARGFGVCVWAHTAYDIQYFTSHSTSHG